MPIVRRSSGIYELDKRLQGGYPKGSIVSLFGRTGLLKKYVALSFLKKGMDAGDKCLYITTRDSIDTIHHHADQFDLELHPIVFLDAVNWRIKRVNPKLETSAQYEVTNLTDLNALLAKIMEACNNTSITRILFDSPTSLLLYTTPGKEQVFKFFELLTAYVRSNEITMCYTMEEGVHPEDVVSTMHYLSDGIILCGFSDTDGYQANVRVQYMTLTKYDTSTITVDI